MQRALSRMAVLIGLALVGMQFVPTAVKRSPVPVSGIRLAQVIDPHAGAILDRSCQDCHSRHTNWPWYGRVAPVSWFLSRDVSRGLEKLDFSEWARRPQSANERMEICDAVSDGSMPLRAYTLIHREAMLSKQDVKVICDWAAVPQAAPSLRAGEPVGKAETMASSNDTQQLYRKGSRRP
jgi:heme-binding protein